MAFNGSGVFNRLYNWVNDAAASIKIRADRMDAEMDGIATGLTTCLTKDGQTTVTANLPMATYRHTGVGDAVNLTDYASFQQLRKTHLYSGTVGGTADVITLTNSPAFAAYVTGQTVSWIASGANTTNVTINVDGLGAKAVTKSGSTALVAGDIISGAVQVAQYDGTRFQLIAKNRQIEAMTIPCSDETTLLTTGTAKVTWRMPYAFTLTDVRGSLSTVATGATLLTVDVNESGTSVISTKLTFDASESTTTTAATPVVISDSALAADAQMTIDIDAVGSTTAGKGLKVTLIGYRT